MLRRSDRVLPRRVWDRSPGSVQRRLRAVGLRCGMLSSGPAVTHMNSCLWSSAQNYSMLDGQLTDAGERDHIYMGGGAVATDRLPMPCRCSKPMHIRAALTGLRVIKHNLLFKSSDLFPLSIHHTKLWMSRLLSHSWLTMPMSRNSCLHCLLLIYLAGLQSESQRFLKGKTMSSPPPRSS